MLILLPAVTAATAMEPRELTAVCGITLPMAVMEYCSPMEFHVAQNLHIMGIRPPLVIIHLKNGEFLFMYSRHRIPDTA